MMKIYPHLHTALLFLHHPLLPECLPVPNLNIPVPQTSDDAHSSDLEVERLVGALEGALTVTVSL